MKKLRAFFPKTQRGFTLLLAVLISSILIALGSAIFDIVAKQILLSSSGRESQFAFYAADTGIECGLYWDNKQDAFNVTSPLVQVSCGGQTVPLTRTYDPNPPDNPGHPRLTTTFSFNFDGVTTGACADVKVIRNYAPTTTDMSSFGHNTCDLTSPLRLERAIRVKY
ncbi:pilus assembly PilX N-terminal domain-containing protein [Candidatus Kaiserbacteria bacterium]|nr:pilus assembly PilX N-terminal domain-containing protein [Candidatus Kaiserbacteria bacterium]